MATEFDQMFDDAAESQLDYWFGATVTLKSGLQETDEFTANWNDQEVESIEMETGLPVKFVSRDYYLPANSLVINGETIEPAAGMVIVDGDEEYEILPLPGRPAAEKQPGGFRWLVHTKRTEGVDP